MKISNRLIAGKKLIENPDNWIKGHYAKFTKNDVSHLYGNDPEATCFCSIGALQRVNANNFHWGDGTRYLDIAAHQLFTLSVTSVNDDLDHKDVMRMWDHAIALAKHDEESYDKH